MTDREEEILTMIRKNPMISQQEIADTLGITRSSTSVHITNLIKKGYIKGRGYIVEAGSYVTVIGAANIDMHGFTNEKLIYQDSNPGVIKISSGGVGRNIAENLARLGITTKFITAIGDDMYGKKILAECVQCGIDTGDALILKDSSTSIYMSIMDVDGDMKLALSEGAAIEKITVDYIKSKHHVLSNSRIIVLETGLSPGVIEYIVTTYKDIPIFLDPVSVKKSSRIKNVLGFFHTLKLNRNEAENLSGITISEEADIKRAISFFLDKGVKNTYITIGSKGVFYNDGNEIKHLAPPSVEVVNATGAGDAFMGGLVYSNLHELTQHESVAFSTGASIVTLSHENTINPSISVETIKNKIKELKIC